MTVTKQRGLGRGLNALFEDEESTFLTSVEQENTAQVDKKKKTISVDELQPGRFQPRKIFDNDSLEELAESIKAHGVLQPILVRAISGSETPFEIIAGERRWRAAQKAQIHEIPAIILDLSDAEALEIGLIENLQRTDLNPVDEAMGYKRLREEYNYTQEKLAESLGKSRSHIANMIRLLNLPDIVLGYLERGDLSIGHARTLITSKDPVALAKIVIDRELNVRETERLASSESKNDLSSTQKEKPQKDVNTAMLEKDLSDSLGLRVSIQSKTGKAGKVVVEFKTLDQLDGFVSKIRA